MLMIRLLRQYWIFGEYFNLIVLSPRLSSVITSRLLVEQTAQIAIIVSFKCLTRKLHNPFEVHGRFPDVDNQEYSFMPNSYFLFYPK